MDQKQMDHFRELIGEKRRKALEQITALGDGVMGTTPKEAAGDLSAYGVHMADHGSDAMEREMGFLMASREGKYIKHLDEALARIDEGTFGTCKTCGKDIADKRLEAVPNATECFVCKSARD